MFGRVLTNVVVLIPGAAVRRMEQRLGALWIGVPLLAVLLASACGDSPTKPTAVTPPTAPAGPVDPVAGPVARLVVAPDELGSRDAIVGLSQVNINAATSSGTGALTYAIDFGDGATTTNPTVTHIYQTPGTFMITAVVRDAAGRTANASGAIAVKTLTGSWFHAAFQPHANRFERRFLTITDQAGPVVRGTYLATGVHDRSFSATLTGPRTLHIVLDDHSAELEGTVPGVLNDNSSLWTFQMRGESVDGQRLAFRPVPAELPGPAPDAVLKVRFDSFGDEVPIAGLSPVQFDGSTSRGDGLTYVMDFGDGEASTQSIVTHRFDREQYVSTQLTVVDRFGRTDTEVQAYPVNSLVDASYGAGWLSNSPLGPKFQFLSRQGLTLIGTRFGDRLVATLSGERDIHIVVDGSPIEFAGYVEMHDGGDYRPPKMILTQHGGADDGRTWTFVYRAGD